MQHVLWLAMPLSAVCSCTIDIAILVQLRWSAPGLPAAQEVLDSVALMSSRLGRILLVPSLSN